MPQRQKKAPEKAQNERITELIARFAPASPLREAVCVSLEARRRQKMAKTGVFGQTLSASPTGC